MRPAPRPSSLVLIAALAAAAACAPPSALDSPGAEEASRGTKCMLASTPGELPDPGVLVDAAAFRAAAGPLWVRAGRPAGHVLFTVRHDAEGAQVRRAVIESTVSSRLADSLQALVFAHRRVTPRMDGEWGVRLRVELGEEMAMTVGRRQLCAPRPREEERIAGNPFDVREKMLGAPVGRSLTDPEVVWVRVRLDAHGRVTEAIVERGLRRGLMEERVLNYARSMAFYPALDDGYPIPSATTVAMNISNIRNIR